MYKKDLNVKLIKETQPRVIETPWTSEQQGKV
jgi:hypothetical protein